jgi:hypothetical protein
MAVTVFADALAQIVSPGPSNNFSANIYICAVSESGIEMFAEQCLWCLELTRWVPQTNWHKHFLLPNYTLSVM